MFGSLDHVWTFGVYFKPASEPWSELQIVSALVKVMQWKACCLDTVIGHSMCACPVLLCNRRCKMSCCHKEVHALLLYLLPTWLTSWPDVPGSTVDQLVNKHSPLTRQRCSCCSHDLWSVKSGLECPTKCKENVFMTVITRVMSHKAYAWSLADFQDGSGNPYCGRKSSYRNPQSEIVLDAFHRRFRDRGPMKSASKWRVTGSTTNDGEITTRWCFYVD